MLNGEFKERLKFYKNLSKGTQKLYNFESQSMVDIKPISGGSNFSYRKKNKMGISKLRHKIKAGKLIKKLAKCSDKAMEKAVRLVKAMEGLKKGYEFLMTDNFEGIYKTGPVSCMRKHLKYLQWYRNNGCKIASLLVNGELVARVIIWHIDGKKYYDRVYALTYRRGEAIEALLKLGKIRPLHEKTHVLEIDLDIERKTPYLDTFRYWNSGLNKLSNKRSELHFYVHNDCVTGPHEIKCKCGNWDTLINITVKHGRVVACSNCGGMRHKLIRSIMSGANTVTLGKVSDILLSNLKKSG